MTRGAASKAAAGVCVLCAVYYSVLVMFSFKIDYVPVVGASTEKEFQFKKPSALLPPKLTEFFSVLTCDTKAAGRQQQRQQAEEARSKQ